MGDAIVPAVGGTLLSGTPAGARSELAARLRVRYREIEQIAIARIRGVSDRPEPLEPVYAESLRAAISAALRYGIDAIELGDERSSIPAALLVQARLAARNGIRLEMVLRRYFAGYTLLADFLVEEAGEADGPALNQLLRAQAAVFDRLITVVSDEYKREVDARRENSEQRRAKRVRRLLGGELLDTSELAYDLDVFHLGAIAAGLGAEDAVRHLAAALECRLLLVRHGEDTVWAWLGSRRSTEFAELGALLGSSWPPQVSLALGEPGKGVAGWRLTHQQASAVLPIALRGPATLVRYAEAALLASILQDDVLRVSLQQLYLDPLKEERDGGEIARQTVRAYVAAERNVSSTAAALGISRNTVASRLRTIEARIGRPLASCIVEFETALRLDELSVHADFSKY